MCNQSATKNILQICLISQNIWDMLEKSHYQRDHTYTEYGHPVRAFFQELETFGLGQTNWAKI